MKSAAKTGTGKYERIFERCAGLEPVPTAVAHPCDKSALAGALEASEIGLIKPILVGPARPHRRSRRGRRHRPRRHRNRRCAEQPGIGRQSGGARPNRQGGAADERQPAHATNCLARSSPATAGLRTGRRISHVFLMDIPTYHKPLIITDAAINIAPTLEDKADICQNAIDLAIALGVEQPKVAILAAVETVNFEDARHARCRRALQDGRSRPDQGGILDGPLAFDNAISREAAETKGIRSAVAGDPDILLVPDLEAGNMLAKQLTFLANADSAGLVLGARVPIILTSRADSVRSRIASCAVAVLAAHARREQLSGSVAHG